MNAVAPFRFEDHDVRCFMRDDQPWFAAVDVCDALDLKNARQVTSKLDADEKGVQISDTLGGRQEIMVLSEGGVYTIMLRSQAAMQPGTKPYRFRKWVTHEVLPAIRRTGCSDIQTVSLPVREPLPRILGNAEDIERARVGIQLVREARVIHGRLGAARMWAQMGFPDVSKADDDARLGLSSHADNMEVPDSVMLWFRERLQALAEHRTKIAELYDDYSRWCVSKYWGKVPIRYFGRSLTRLGVEKVHSDGTWVVGLVLVD